MPVSGWSEPGSGGMPELSGVPGAVSRGGKAPGAGEVVALPGKGGKPVAVLPSGPGKAGMDVSPGAAGVRPAPVSGPPCNGGNTSPEGDGLEEGKAPPVVSIGSGGRELGEPVGAVPVSGNGGKLEPPEAGASSLGKGGKGAWPGVPVVVPPTMGGAGFRPFVL